MTERTKRPKSKVTWSDVKSKLADFDRAGLQQLVANLYVFHKDNQTFLHARFGLGENPLEAYKQRIQASKGLRSVLEGSIPSFSMEYPCHSPTEQRWFVMNVAPVSGEEFGAVVSHVNISAWYDRGVK